MPPAGIDPTISAGERPQTYAIDCAANANGNNFGSCLFKISTSLHEDQIKFYDLYVIHILCTRHTTQLRGLSPRANYTDRAAAAGRRS